MSNTLSRNRLINIGYTNRVRFFSLESANELLPIIIKITRKASNSIKLHNLILQHQDLNEAFLRKVDVDKQKIIVQWTMRLEQLGVSSSRFGMALFDTGYGYLYWRFPQYQLRSFVLYDDDLSNEQCVEKIKYTHPTWLTPKPLNLQAFNSKSTDKENQEPSVQQSAQ